MTLDGEDQKRLDSLNKSLSNSKYTTNKASYLLWLKCFEEGEEGNKYYQVKALLAYWLSYFVFPSSLEDGLHSYVFPPAVLLAKGERLALVPFYLGSLYTRLDEKKNEYFQANRSI